MMRLNVATPEFTVLGFKIKPASFTTQVSQLQFKLLRDGASLACKMLLEKLPSFPRYLRVTLAFFLNQPRLFIIF